MAEDPQTDVSVPAQPADKKNRSNSACTHGGFMPSWQARLGAFGFRPPPRAFAKFVNMIWREANVRSFGAISVVFVALYATPVAARDYPWCAKTITNDFNGDCSFTSYRQCMATVSGQRGECMQNPRLVFDRARRWRNRPSSGGWQDDGWQDSGRNNRW
jgi:hypothetical protein